MPKKLPWQIKPKLHTVTNGAASIEVPDYGSLVVDEIEYLKGLPDDLGGEEFAKTFVAFCMRIRFELSDDTTDDDIINGLETPTLIEPLFNFFVYGTDGPPKKEAPSAKAKKRKSQRTGQKSSGGSSSTTPITHISQASTLDDAPSTSPEQPSTLTKMSA